MADTKQRKVGPHAPRFGSIWTGVNGNQVASCIWCRQGIVRDAVGEPWRLAGAGEVPVEKS